MIHSIQHEELYNHIHHIYIVLCKLNTIFAQSSWSLGVSPFIARHASPTVDRVIHCICHCVLSKSQLQPKSSVVDCCHIWPAMYPTFSKCCASASLVGGDGIVYIYLPFWVNKICLSSIEGLSARIHKAGVESSKSSLADQSVRVPLRPNEDVTSQPVRAWKAARAVHLLPPSDCAMSIMAVASMYRNVFPVAKASHRLPQSNFRGRSCADYHNICIHSSQ